MYGLKMKLQNTIMLKLLKKPQEPGLLVVPHQHLKKQNPYLGKRKKELRTKLKISQDQLAKKANIPFSTLVKIEAGYTPNPSMETLIKIADAFEITIDELVGRRKK